MQVDGQVPVDLSRIIVTVSIEQPWPVKNVRSCGPGTMNFQRVMVNNATNVGFCETCVETKEDDVRTGVASDETLLMTVESTPSHTVILVVIMGVLSSVIPTLRIPCVNEEDEEVANVPRR